MAIHRTTRPDVTRANDGPTRTNQVAMDFSRPGRPTDNPFIESYNDSFRDELLDTHWFLSLDDAREKIVRTFLAKGPLMKNASRRALSGRWSPGLAWARS